MADPGGMLVFERDAWGRGFRRVAGVDEAGRGPWAGPVVAAAVYLDPLWAGKAVQGDLAGLTDSKRLTARQRDRFHDRLTGSPHVRWAVARVEAGEIDELNILRATHLAMRRALESLRPPADYALVDGLPVPGLPVDARALVGGDAASLSVAAASVLAKVTRDRIMAALDGIHPVYGFASHKGYGTRMHLESLRRHGPCEEHRQSFRPVRQAAPPALAVPAGKRTSPTMAGTIQP